jgi:uncharacterized SAM-binding protein YcdF (DUF218 family)
LRKLGLWATVGCLVLLYLLGTNQVSVWLAQGLLPQYEATTASVLRQHKTQVVVVLGGGVDQYAPEYDGADLQGPAYMRLRYGVGLAKELNVPLVVSGGLGWSSHDDGNVSEAEVACQIAAREWQFTNTIAENKSRDTRENAQLTRHLLPGPTRTIALVTHSWHMPRAVRHFQAAGFDVHPAPMGYILLAGTFSSRWIPTASSLRDSSWVLRERLGLWLTAP